MNAPRLARLLLRICTPQDLRDDTLGDLEETYRRRAVTGSLGAWLVTMFDAVLIAMAMCWRRVLSLRFMSGDLRGFGVYATDLRLAGRLMYRQPLLTLTATVALTVGIAIATVGFAMMEAMLFSRLPFEGGDRFVFVQATQEPDGDVVRLSAEDARALATTVTSLQHLGGVTEAQENVVLPSGQIAVATVAGLTPSTWQFVPHSLVAGRPFAASDGVAGATPVAWVREGFRESVMAASDDGTESSVIGSTVVIGGVPHDVIGVVPDTVKFPNTPDIWVAVDEGFLVGRSRPDPDVRLLGILAPGVSLQTLHAELAAIAASRPPDGSPGALRLTATGYTDLGSIGRDLSVVSIIVVLSVLMVIAANVGNLILARSFARSREFALRAALGASRARLVAQVFLEVLVIAAVAGIVGSTSAQAVLRLFNGMDEIPFWVDFSGGPRTTILVLASAVAAAVVAGVWPAMRATRVDLAGQLEHGGGRAGDLRFGRMAGVMVVTQIAVSIVMLHGALVVAQGFQKFTGASLDLPRNVLTSYLNVDGVQSTTDGRPTAPVSAAEIVRLVGETPGVLAVGIGTALPRHSPRGVPVQVEPTGGLPPEAARLAPEVEVTRGYFAALDAQVLAGREFSAVDFLPDAQPVTVVNEPFVRKFFGNASPLGQRIRVDTTGAWREVIGVVPDLGLSVGDESLAGGYYVPLRPDTTGVYIAVRTLGDSMTLVSPVREALLERDPAFVFGGFELLEDVAHEDRDFFKWFSMALLGIGTVTLMLALAGVYAMMSLIVTRRTREIGVRIALGSTAFGVVKTVLGRAAIQVSIGGVVGAILAVLSLNVRSVLVSRMGDGGAWTLPTVLVLLASAGMVATWLPLRRALGVQAADALRTD